MEQPFGRYVPDRWQWLSSYRLRKFGTQWFQEHHDKPEMPQYQIQTDEFFFAEEFRGYSPGISSFAD